MTIFAPNDLQEVIVNRNRLMILGALSNEPSLDFVALRERLDIVDGSLHHALKKLRDAKCVAISKSHDENGKSRTTIKLTELGRRSFNDYLNDVKALWDKVHVDEQKSNTQQ